MTLWLYLHFSTLQLDNLFKPAANTSDKPTEAEPPTCLIHQHKIVQVNQAAIQYGIKTGMGLGSAAALCHSLQVYSYSAESEEKKLLEIAEWLYIFTSDIALYPPCGLLLKISNMLTLYDNLNNYWHKLKQHLEVLKLNYHYATGYSPLAARLMAKAGWNTISEDQNLLQKQLAKYPIAATDLPVKTTEKLHRVGIRSIQALLKLEMAELGRRFEIELVNYVGQLTGRFKTPVNFYLPSEHFQRYVEFLYEINNCQRLTHPLNKLLLELETFLKWRDLIAYELTLILHHRENKQQQLALTSAQGDWQAAKWDQLSRLSLESIKLEAPIIAISLLAKRTGQAHASSHDLFSNQQGNLSSLELISILQAKLGQQAIQGITLTDDPRPEKTTLLCSPLQQAESTMADKPIKANKIRPSFLFPSPIPLTEKVKLIDGPERVATGWWDANKVVRDYYIATGKQGKKLWVFRNQQKQWFVHGLFS